MALSRGLMLLLGLGMSAALAAPTGLYADWRRQAWKSPETALDAVSGPAADPDGDGVANFAEYAFGLDPHQSDFATAVRWRIDSGTGLVVDHRFWTGALEAEVQVEWRSRLDGSEVWRAADGGPLTVANVETGAASTRREARLDVAGDSAFVRLAAAAVPPRSPSTRYVWFEAEPPNGESHPLLSNDQMVWISPGGSVQKTVSVPEPGTYQLWVRKFYNQQEFRWRTAPTDAWNTVHRDTPVTDLVELGPGRKVGWSSAGPVDLTAGSRTFRLEVPATETGTTAYDCFLLTQSTFTPRGELKPDQPFAAAQEGWFSFQPEPDPFTYSPIDLRSLNERVAGDHGFIQVRGEDFVHETSGEPVRFWAVNAGPGVAGLAKPEVDRLARTLAKRGVNLVRYHGPIYTSSGTNFGAIDTNAVARVHDLVAALKREGIYTSLSIYFPLWVTLDASTPQFPGYNRQHPFALPYFDAAFQAVYRQWWQHLLTVPNPQTGRALRDDPAVAMVEMINEDSTLFWTFNPDAGAAGNIPDAQRRAWEQQFGQWLLARYAPRTLADIRSQVWGGTTTSQDDLPNGRLGFRNLWTVFNSRTRRDQDTAEFLMEIMRRFYTETRDYLRGTLGFRGLIYASNWKTASPQYLDPLDKLANGAGDFFDRHGYFSGAHTGTNASWAIQAGQAYDDRAAVRFQPESGTGESFDNPVFDLIYDGRPSTISEVNWPLPNRFRADMVILGAAYGALQGSDGLFWFATAAPAWDNLPGKFSIQTPVALGQFPAAALLFRRGLVRPGPWVVDFDLTVKDLCALRGTPLPAPQNFDALRGGDVPPGGTLTNVAAIDSLAFAVGRVGTRFVTHTNPQARTVDLSPYIHRTNKVVTSATGELRWDWGRGLVTVNAPAAQGATGFLRDAGPIDLPGLRIQSGVEYGSVLLVALDPRPIAQASRLLLQVMSEDQPYRWQTSTPTGTRTITAVGEAPVLVKLLSGTVTLQRPDAAALTVTPLDFNGYRVPGAASTGGTVVLQTNRLYYLIEAP